jgi:hypothetical protein
MQNESIYNVCKRNFNIDNLSHVTLNRLIAQSASSITASYRFKSDYNMTLSNLHSNLVCFPRLNSLISSFGPIKEANKKCKKAITQNLSVLTSQAFEKDQMMVDTSTKGKYLAASVIYRGGI